MAPASLECQLRDQVQAALGARELCVRALAREAAFSAPADNPLKFLVQTADGRPLGVVHCSQPDAPGMSARSVERCRAAKRRLGPRLGRVILDPLCEGAIEGVSFSCYPWRQPLFDSRFAGLVQRRMLRGPVLDWLAEVLRETQHVCDQAERARTFAQPLQYVAGESALPPALRTAAAHALAELASGAWAPRTAVAHNDLWSGNVLTGSTVRTRWPQGASFTIIDWDGSMLDGIPLFDLVRLAGSWDFAGGLLRRQVQRQVALLDCAPVAASHYLAAAIGAIGLHREQFPMPRYVEMSRLAHERLSHALREA